MENDLRRILLEVATDYAKAEDCALSTVARRGRNDPSFFERLKNPSRSFTARTYDQMMLWFLANWPEGRAQPLELLKWATENAKAPVAPVAADASGVDAVGGSSAPQIANAVEWLVKTPRHLRDKASVPTLRKRFGLTAKQACEAIAHANLRKGSA